MSPVSSRRSDTAELGGATFATAHDRLCRLHDRLCRFDDGVRPAAQNLRDAGERAALGAAFHLADGLARGAARRATRGLADSHVPSSKLVQNRNTNAWQRQTVPIAH